MLNLLFALSFFCLEVVKEVLPCHLPGCHRLDCRLLLPNGVVGSPGTQLSKTWTSDTTKIIGCNVIMTAVSEHKILT